jgi:deoxyhypusine synthase
MKKREMDPVEDLKLPASYSEMARQMENSGGFSAKKFGVGVSILTEVMSNDECYTFLSMPAAPLSTGMRGIVRHLVQKKRVDAIITTCGFLDHDVARTYTDYYRGDFMMDDGALGEEGINRLGRSLNQCIKKAFAQLAQGNFAQN